MRLRRLIKTIPYKTALGAAGTASKPQNLIVLAERHAGRSLQKFKNLYNFITGRRGAIPYGLSGGYLLLKTI